jgi:phage head maturation protease
VSDEEAQAQTTEDVITLVAPAEIEVRDAAKREIDMRLLPWDMEIDTLAGPELFRRGAFAGTDPGKVLLMGPDHQARMGVGQDGKPRLARIVIGKALSLTERDDGAHATFKVARTQDGDETLALASDGIVGGVSIEFSQIAGGTDIEHQNGRRRRPMERNPPRVNQRWEAASATLESRVLAR